jgi:predicted nucleic acid-binding protein
MKVLFDTNIVIHRETPNVVNQEIGVLFRWIDNLKYSKWIHPVTITEINNHRDKQLRKNFNIKMESYNLLQAGTPFDPRIAQMISPLDQTHKDQNDTIILNELVAKRVDLLITEDRGIHKKAETIGILDQVYTIDAFLEKVLAENPGLVDYKVLSVKKEYIGNINLNDPFFNSFKNDYPGFDIWLRKKSQEHAYICTSDSHIEAFLYLKIEEREEPYSDIEPPFQSKKRLKVGSFKVLLNGYRLGERFLKIIFDNAFRHNVDEIYVTVFDKDVERERLIQLLEDYGFCFHGLKINPYGNEKVYVRKLEKQFNPIYPKLTYPYFSKQSRVFLVAIRPEYHTDLFPDSILRTESPANFVEHEPFRNAIQKAFVGRPYYRDLIPGDVLIFYRTGGYHKSVITTIGIAEKAYPYVSDYNQFIDLCIKRSVFADEELKMLWNKSGTRPFVVNFLYAYSFPKRPNLKRLIEIGVIRDISSAPRCVEQITSEAFRKILLETNTDERLIVD